MTESSYKAKSRKCGKVQSKQHFPFVPSQDCRSIFHHVVEGGVVLCVCSDSKLLHVVEAFVVTIAGDEIVVLAAFYYLTFV